MKKNLLYLFIICFSISFAQQRKGQLYLSSASKHDLHVSFGLNVTLNPTTFFEDLKENNSDFKLLVDQYGFELEKDILISEEKLLSMEESAMKISGNADAIKKLRNIFKVKIDNPTNERLFEVGQALEQLKIVEYCNLTSLEPTKPPVDIPPTTANFEVNQTYIQSNPGVNMQYAWNLGLNGQNIKMRDVEYGFNKNHEELDVINTSIATGMNVSTAAYEDYTEHGTAVFGILYAHKGTFGISGMAYGASELVLFPEWQQSGYNRINAVSQSVTNSTIGDIIVYEMQADGPAVESTPNAAVDYVMAEYNQVIWDLTKAATDAGITVVAAAGNGYVNLDTPSYATYNARGDSGAIIVGAGASNTSHNRLAYSTYGARVNLQGWGQDVQAIGKLGTAYTLVGNDFNQSYVNFSGTSSATPIVASCATVLQSYYFSLTGNYLTSQQLRTIMQQTGIAQGTGVSGNIGPLPNMEAAIQEVYDQSLGLNEETKFKFQVYPNPVSNQFTILSGELISNDAKVEVYTSLGQVVLTTNLTNDKVIDVSQLSNGFYFVKISENNRSFIQKIIKK